jgi:sodium/potassium-transporting ATPase subunit alpha
VVIVLQASFSAFQDWSSSKVMKSIKNLIPSKATVIRTGAELNISAEEVVIGDVVVLSYGNKVPADLRIIECHDLKFDRSLLTGESDAVDGSVECTDESLLESRNIAFMTSLVTNGCGRGVVIATGKNTMIGKIATLAHSTSQKKTTLQKDILRFVYLISTMAILNVIILVIVWFTYLRVYYPTYINVPTM